jgi:hypothetical protein
MKIFQFFAIAAIPILLLLPIPDNAFTICPFFHLTTLPCPFCGLGRSLIHIYHLDFIGAFYYNPLGYILFFAQMYLVVSLFSPSLLEFALKQSKSLVTISILLLFISFGSLRIWLILQGDLDYSKYFYDFHQTFSFARWVFRR